MMAPLFVHGPDFVNESGSIHRGTGIRKPERLGNPDRLTNGIPGLERTATGNGRGPVGCEISERTALLIVGLFVVALVATNGVHDVAQTGLNGLSLGSVYALGAVGLTLIYGILKLVNFAHGEFLTFGAYMAYVVSVTWGGPLVLGHSVRDRDYRVPRRRLRARDVGADAGSQGGPPSAPS